jgi:hypothetical protein
VPPSAGTGAETRVPRLPVQALSPKKTRADLLERDRAQPGDGVASTSVTIPATSARIACFSVRGRTIPGPEPVTRMRNGSAAKRADHEGPVRAARRARRPDRGFTDATHKVP